jgi:hypothetical protein
VPTVKYTTHFIFDFNLPILVAIKGQAKYKPSINGIVGADHLCPIIPVQGTVIALVRGKVLYDLLFVLERNLTVRVKYIIPINFNMVRIIVV